MWRKQEQNAIREGVHSALHGSSEYGNVLSNSLGVIMAPHWDKITVHNNIQKLVYIYINNICNHKHKYNIIIIL